MTPKPRVRQNPETVALWKQHNNIYPQFDQESPCFSTFFFGSDLLKQFVAYESSKTTSYTVFSGL